MTLFRKFRLAYRQRSYLLLLAFVVLFILSPAPTAGQEPVGDERIYLPLVLGTDESSFPQLLLNPSFEAEPDGITPWAWLSPEVDYQLYNDPDLARDGQQYLAVNRRTQTAGNKSFYQEVSAPQAGRTYHFAIWVRASEEAVTANSPRTGRIDLSAQGGADPREHSTHNFAVADIAWHCVETSLKVNETDHTTLRAELYLTSLDAFDTYIDHAILRDDGQATCSPEPVIDGSTFITEGQGFDTCAAPTADHLSTWKQASPYEYFGLYLGGANHYSPCRQYNQQYQTPAWFEAVAQQGWRFIPIWVGLQAPCTSYTARLSYDPGEARGQGIQEAREALEAAQTLGLVSSSRRRTIIYFDMEPYTLSADCHTAVNAFFGGWVSELQAQGHRAGIYGSARVANDWYTLDHVPDSVWIPWYVRSGYDPGMTVDTANERWVSESYWDNHRLFQYSNSHTEGWGGVTLNIDNDAARGLIALDETPAGSNPPVLQEMGLISADQGWLRFDWQLFRGDASGRQWIDVTPPAIEKIEAVFFLDPAHGWVVSSTGPDPALSLSQTRDGGQNWQTVPLPALSGAYPGASAAYLEFIDPQKGWLALKLATGASFSRGLLFKTEDGGESWIPLSIPLGEPVNFINEMDGWTAGGPTNGELYVTRDGGQSWQAQVIVEANLYPVYQLPVFETEQVGTTAVTVNDADQSRIEFYTTQDGGRSWHPANSIALSRKLALGTTLPIDILDSQHRLVADPQFMPGLPQNIVALDLATPTNGWAQTLTQSCTDLCRSQSGLFRTGDGGQTWMEIELPLE